MVIVDRVRETSYRDLVFYILLCTYILAKKGTKIMKITNNDENSDF